MRLKNTAFVKNVTVKIRKAPKQEDGQRNKKKYKDSSTADWGQEISQGKNGAFSKQGIDSILSAMVCYKKEDIDAFNNIKVALKEKDSKGNVRCAQKLLKNYKTMKFPLVAIISKVYLDEKLLKNQSICLFLQIKKGKCFLKFNDSLEYKGKNINAQCFDAISQRYGSNSSWAILQMNVKIEKEKGLDVCNLYLYGIKIADNKYVYDSPDDRDAEFERLWNEQHPFISLEEDASRNEEKKRKGPRKAFSPSQVIYYGVPGCGKSWQIQEELKKKKISEANKQMVRVVFHPDYSNADFVGQILPVVKNGKGVDYQFKPGPFTKILRSAYENGNKEYALVIEEINRGNAAAIFGDLFQLLDRIPKDGEPEEIGGNSYGPGWSSYCVMNDYVNAYFREKRLEDGGVTTSSSNVLYDILVNENLGIRLPPNLSIYATMNTSDQNVFSLDNAFQRRWNMMLIPNQLEKKNTEQRKQFDQVIEGTDIRWGEFRDKINRLIGKFSKNSALSSTEDKRLGLWFVVPENKPRGKSVISLNTFAEKVLKYLWDDAFKFNRCDVFRDENDKEFESFDALVEKFKEIKFDVFVDSEINEKT